MSQARAKLIKKLRTILCVFNALLTISVVIQVVEFITKLALKSKKVQKKTMKKLQGQLIASNSFIPENANLSFASLSFLAGDIVILSITVIVGWIGIITFKRRILYVYTVLMVVDFLYSLLLIIRDTSADSWLIMCDVIINISICIVMYCLIKELTKSDTETAAERAVNGNISHNNLRRLHSNTNGGYPNGPILTSPTSATSVLGTTLEPIEGMSEIPETDIENYLNSRRATIWSNGSLLCEAPPSSYWDTSLCIPVAHSPYSINCDPPPPWSPPEDSSLSESLGLNNISLDDNNNVNGNNYNIYFYSMQNGQVSLTVNSNNNVNNNQRNNSNNNNNNYIHNQQVISNGQYIEPSERINENTSDNISLNESSNGTICSEETITDVQNA